MVFLLDIVCVIALRDVLLPTGWFAAAGLGVFAALHIDKRRSINGALSQIEMIKDTVYATEDGQTAHKDTLNDLKKCVFAALPLFSKRKQKLILEAWSSYRALNFATLHDDDLALRVMRGIGRPVTFKFEAVVNGLDGISKTMK